MRLMEPKGQKRSAAAAVELAVCVPFLLVVLSGVWEVGRMVQVHNLMANASREGGRQAAAGLNSNATICQNVVNYLTMNGLTGISSKSVSGSTTSGSATVTMSSTTGLTAGMQVTGTGIPSGTTISSVKNSTQITLSQNATATASGVSFIAGNVSLTNLTNAGRSDPTTATQLDQFQLTVTIPYSAIQWSTIAQITPTTTLSASSIWNSMLNLPCTIDNTIPGN